MPRARAARAGMAWMITGRDEALLTWFFGIGQVAFERSPTGAVLERAFLFSTARDERKDRRARVRKARPKRSRAKHSSEPWDPFPVTAFPTAEVRLSQGYEPEDQLLRRYAHVSRLLKLVEQRDPLAAQVLEHYYGDPGARWGRTPGHTRLFAVTHFTQAGRTLLHESAEQANRNASGPELELPPHERMGVLAEVQRVQPKKRRRELLRESEIQAARLLSSACAVWREVKTHAAY